MSSILRPLKHPCAAWRLFVILLVTWPSETRAAQYGDFGYEVRGTRIQITDYSGSGGDVVIPDSIEGLPVTLIGVAAFRDSTSLTNLTIPNSVVYVGAEAFRDCISLASVTIPNSVTTIGDYAFNGCKVLTTVTIPDSVLWIGSYAFSGCTSLTGVTIPDSVTRIGSYAFSGCTSLTGVTIPDSVTSIGQQAFSRCTSLTSVTIGNSVTSIGESAFFRCTSLTRITIPDSVISIEEAAFSSCTSLISVTIGNSVTSIGEGAFSGCTSLTAIEVDPLNPAYSSLGGLLLDKSQATLIQCPEGRTGSITIPDSVTLIGYAAFSGCTGLTSVTIGNSVTTIRERAFRGCTSLTAIEVDPLNPVYGSLDGVLSDKSQRTLIRCPEGKAGSYTIPDSVTSIGSSVFSGCTRLTSITIPESVTSIGDNAFQLCRSLTSVTIPDSVTSIGGAAFAECYSLTGVYFQGDAPAFGEGPFPLSFGGTTGATLYHLPGATGWEATMAGRPTSLWSGRFGLQAIQAHAGLTITGPVGGVYSIDYVTDLTEPTESDWRCLEFLQLPASPYLWADKSAPVTGQRFYRAVAMEAPTNMVFIPPGTFRMGTPEDEVDRWENEGPQRDVIISQGFWMGQYEVTQGEYEAVMGDNPSHYYIGYPDLPVENVSWDDATAYCDALTERERLAGRIAANSVYRLPTEAEWEYACRAWTSARFSYGDDPGYTNLTNYAWYEENSDGQTHPVGQKLPNPWGLYDMHGNVTEWCQDWLVRSGGLVVDPQGPDTGSFHGIRGGDWSRLYGGARDCRSASRYDYRYGPPDSVSLFVGFRAVLAPGQP